VTGGIGVSVGVADGAVAGGVGGAARAVGDTIGVSVATEGDVVGVGVAAVGSGRGRAGGGSGRRGIASGAHSTPAFTSKSTTPGSAPVSALQSCAFGRRASGPLVKGVRAVGHEIQSFNELVQSLPRLASVLEEVREAVHSKCPSSWSEERRIAHDQALFDTRGVLTVCSTCKLDHEVSQAIGSTAKGNPRPCPFTYLTPVTTRLRACQRSLSPQTPLHKDKRRCSLCGTFGHTIADCALATFGGEFVSDLEEEDEIDGLSDDEDEGGAGKAEKASSLAVGPSRLGLYNSANKRHCLDQKQFPLCCELATLRGERDDLGSCVRKALNIESLELSALEAVVLCFSASRGLACAWAYMLDTQSSHDGQSIQVSALLREMVSAMWCGKSPGDQLRETFQAVADSGVLQVDAVHDVQGCAVAVLGYTSGSRKSRTVRRRGRWPLFTPLTVDSGDAEYPAQLTTGTYDAVESECGIVVSRTARCTAHHLVPSTFVQSVMCLTGRSERCMLDAVQGQLAFDAAQQRPHHPPLCTQGGGDCLKAVNHFDSFTLLHGPATFVMSLQQCSWSVVSDSMELAVGNGALHYKLLAVSHVVISAGAPQSCPPVGKYRCTFVRWGSAIGTGSFNFSDWDTLKRELTRIDGCVPVLAVYTVSPESRHNAASLRPARCQHPGDVVGGFSNFLLCLALKPTLAGLMEWQRVGVDGMTKYDPTSELLGLIRQGMTFGRLDIDGGMMEEFMSRGMVFDPNTYLCRTSAQLALQNVRNIVSRLRALERVGWTRSMLPRVAVDEEASDFLCSAVHALLALPAVLALALASAEDLHQLGRSPLSIESSSGPSSEPGSGAESLHLQAAATLSSLLFTELAIIQGERWGVRSVQWLDYLWSLNNAAIEATGAPLVGVDLPKGVVDNRVAAM
jgi:hypothetical protein